MCLLDVKGRGQGHFQGQGQSLSSRCHFSTGAEWSILVLLPSTAKDPVKHKSATLLKTSECSSQGAFKMVGFSKWVLFRQVDRLR